MKKMIVLSLLLGWASCVWAAALPEKPAGSGGEFHWIDDGGFERRFEVALDELSVPAQGGRQVSRTVAATGSLAEIRQRAIQWKQDTGEDVELVLYEAGAKRTPYSRRVLTKQVLVRAEPGADLAGVAALAGDGAWVEVDYAPGLFLVETDEIGGALDLADRLRGQPGVLGADPLLARLRQKKWMPNDTLFSQQWHLRNTGQGGGTPGIDVNITNAWASYRGSNVLIGIVDDGLQLNHTDLWQNVSTTLGWNWNGNNSNPNPVPGNEDYHGTSCAGVAAARGNNGRGVSGAAPYATLVGYRLIGGEATDAMEASAMLTNNALVHIKSNSWGPYDDGQTLEAPGALTLAALSNAATTGRGGRGTILVWAGGNGLDENDNSNYDGYANSIYTIAVAALTDGGLQSWYSEPGANLVVTAPSSGGATDIVTTDLMGNDGYNPDPEYDDLADVNYTETFGGTSSSTPLVAGIVALMLEANPELGWRDVQEILIRSATRNHAADPGWRTNAAGRTFNHKYGAGLVNASAAVALAETWTNLGPQVRSTVIQTNLNRAIPDNNPAGITQSFVVASAQNLRVEHVTVTLDIRHTYRGDLEITLVSPSGMESRLAEKHGDGGNHYPSWTFSSVRHWGEEAEGTWNLKVADLWEADVGTMQWARVDFYGTALNGGGAGSSYLVDFEDASKGGYAAGDVVLNGLAWNLSEAVIGNLDGDRRIGGWSARVRSNETANGTGILAMNTDLDMGLSAITLWHAKYGGDANTAGRVDYSTNSGATWTSAGTFDVTSTNLTLFSATNLNVTGNVRVRVVKTSGTTTRYNIDDITLHPYSALPPSGTPPTLDPIDPRAAIVGQTLYHVVTATEPDGDPVTVACATAVNPARWSFNTNSGAFAFTPATNELGTVSFTFTATDKDGTSAPVAMSVTVLAPQDILTFDLPPNGAAAWVSIESQAGVTYRLQYSTDLRAVPQVWLPADEEEGTGNPLLLQDENPSKPQRFYRVVVP